MHMKSSVSKRIKYVKKVVKVKKGKKTNNNLDRGQTMLRGKSMANVRGIISYDDHTPESVKIKTSMKMNRFESGIIEA